MIINILNGCNYFISSYLRSLKETCLKTREMSVNSLAHTPSHIVLNDTAIMITLTQRSLFLYTAAEEFYYVQCINDTICYAQQCGHLDKVLKCFPLVMCDMGHTLITIA